MLFNQTRRCSRDDLKSGIALTKGPDGALGPQLRSLLLYSTCIVKRLYADASIGPDHKPNGTENECSSCQFLLGLAQPTPNKTDVYACRLPAELVVWL